MEHSAFRCLLWMLFPRLFLLAVSPVSVIDVKLGKPVASVNPQLPPDIDIQDLTTKSVQLTWSFKKASEEYSIYALQVLFKQKDGEIKKFNKKVFFQNKTILKDLLPMTEYYIRVQALGDNGWSIMSKQYHFLTLKDLDEKMIGNKKKRDAREKLQRNEKKQERREERRKMKVNDDYDNVEFETRTFPLSVNVTNRRSDLANPKDGNIDYIAKNLSSIWKILALMQKDIRQIKRYHRINSKSTKMETKFSNRDPESLEEIVDEECDPEYASDGKGCRSFNGTICDNHGRCSCGQCLCSPPYYGSNCQCNDEMCFVTNGLMCGGSDRGQCRCGSCVCRPGFSGEACECSTEMENCINSKSQTCSNKGSCLCNRCHCEDGSFGTLCEETIHSASICEHVKLCVLCLAFGKKYPQCADCKVNTNKVEKLDASENLCLMIQNNCLLKYSYTLPRNPDGSLNVLVENSMTC